MNIRKFICINTLGIIVLTHGVNVLAQDKQDKQDKSVSLPGLPVSVVEVNKKKSKDLPDKPKKKADSVKGKVFTQEALIVPITPGRNTIIDIAEGFLNKFVTPFERPVIVAGSKLEHTSKGNIVYLGAEGNRPIGIYISDQSDPENSISLTLIPKKVPPREVQLRIEGVNSNVGTRMGKKLAEKFETSSDYVQTLYTMATTVAKGFTPDGYVLRDPTAEDMDYKCHLPDLNTEQPKQVLEGRRMRILISTVTNTTDEVREVLQHDCAKIDGVLAAGTWPYTKLMPGESTELYIIVRRYLGYSPKRKRPSLLTSISR